MSAITPVFAKDARVSTVRCKLRHNRGPNSDYEEHQYGGNTVNYETNDVQNHESNHLGEEM